MSLRGAPHSFRYLQFAVFAGMDGYSGKVTQLPERLDS